MDSIKKKHLGPEGQDRKRRSDLSKFKVPCHDAPKQQDNRKILNNILRRLSAKMDSFGIWTKLPIGEKQNIISYATMLSNSNKGEELNLLAHAITGICSLGLENDRSYFNLTYLNKLLGSKAFLEAAHFAMGPVAAMAQNLQNRDLLYFHLDSVRTIADDNFLSKETAGELFKMAMELSGKGLSMAFHELIIRLRAGRKMENEKSNRELGKKLRAIDRFERESRNPHPPIIVKKQA